MQWIPVGKITKTHGLKGELKFLPFISDEEICKNFKKAVLEGEEEIGSRRTIKSIRGRHSRLILRFKDCDSIETAQSFVGRTLLIHRDDFTELPEGEYYWFEIEGLNVFDEEGRPYGQVKEVIPTGSNDVYVVSDGKKEILLPMIDSVVKTIDLKERKLIFHIVEGLLEDNPV